MQKLKTMIIKTSNLNNVSLEEFASRVADRVISMLRNTTQIETIAPPPKSDDILFKSLKEAAEYYGVCYQTISKHLDKIKHMPMGKSKLIYKSDLEKALSKSGLLSKKR